MIEASPQQVVNKPLESKRNESPADKNRDWRKKVEGVVKAPAGKAIENRAYVELPYQSVPPIANRTETQPVNLEKQVVQPDAREYEVRAPVQRDGLGRALADKVLDTEVTIDIRDLAGVSPEVRETIRRDLTKSRRPLNKGGFKKVMFADELEQTLPFENEEEELRLEYDALNLSELDQDCISRLFRSEMVPSIIYTGLKLFVQDNIARLKKCVDAEVIKAGTSATYVAIQRKVHCREYRQLNEEDKQEYSPV